MTWMFSMVCFALIPASAVDALDTARQALRDGLWEVVRIHAGKSQDDEARLMVLESFAREGKWDRVQAKLDEWGDLRGEGFVYYRAAAAVEKQDYDHARKILEKPFGDPVYVKLALRLRARMAADSGNVREALGLMESSLVEDTEYDALMYMAELRSRIGDRDGAARLWRKIVADTNANPHALSVAAVNLGDVQSLRRIYSRPSPAPLKRMVGLKLGRELLKSPDTSGEGVKLIRNIVRDAPDADGALDAFLAMADGLAASARWQEALAAYREAMEIWPDVSRRSSFQTALGSACLSLSRGEDAMAAFKRAFDVADDDEDRARALLRQGDALAESGDEDASFSLYRSVVSRYPRSRAAAGIRGLVEIRELESRGRELYREFRFEDAQRVFASVADSDPSRKARMDYLQVLCLYGRGLDAQAERGAMALVSGCADSAVRAEAVYWLARYYYNQGRWKESASLFRDFSSMPQAGDRGQEALLWAARSAFADNDFKLAIQTATGIVSGGRDSPVLSQALMVQGEALIELARFDEAVLVFGRVLVDANATAADRLRSRVLRADALFAIGADNPACYKSALDAYRAVLLVEELDPSERIVVSYKVARTLDKLKLADEAVDQYYSQVLVAYRNGRLAGERYSDDARAAFSRAGFTLADWYEGRGHDHQALRILELIAESDVPAAKEARRRIGKISTKGGFL